MAFVKDVVCEREIKGKRVLEVGAMNVNGTIRPIIEAFGPMEYVATDMLDGLGVDIVVPAEELTREFGKSSFDAVFCVETLEHMKTWVIALRNMKAVCKLGGIILLTARGPDFPRHDYPSDYWRFTEEDMAHILGDCTAPDIRPDPEMPGLFAKAKKPKGFKIKDLSKYRVAGID